MNVRGEQSNYLNFKSKCMRNATVEQYLRNRDAHCFCVSVVGAVMALKREFERNYRYINLKRQAKDRSMLLQLKDAHLGPM